MTADEFRQYLAEHWASWHPRDRQSTHWEASQPWADAIRALGWDAFWPSPGPGFPDVLMGHELKVVDGAGKPHLVKS